MRKIWIIGSSGQIGTALNDMLNPLDFEVFDTDHSELDITRINDVINFAVINRPSIIIDCAGIASYKECENDPQKAYLTNTLGARNIAIAAAKVSAKIVYISTDDVFDGTAKTPYGEFDQTNPQSVYGKSKLYGENFVKDLARRHFIIRSTWVYGQGDNFVNYILNYSKNHESIEVTNEQMGSPTSANVLAKFILKLVQGSEYGTYHVTCQGVCSRAEFATEVLRLAGSKTKVIAVPGVGTKYSENHPTYAVLDNFILKIENHYKLPTWQKALEDYFKKPASKKGRR